MSTTYKMYSIIFCMCFTLVACNLTDVPIVYEKPLPPISNDYSKLPIQIVESSQVNQRTVCFLETAGTIFSEIDITEINRSLCTHLIISSVIDNDGQIAIRGIKDHRINTVLTNLRTLKHHKVKLLISWGEWNDNVQSYTRMIQSLNTRTVIIKNLVDFIKMNEFDGLDINWTFQSVLNIDIKSNLLLLKEFQHYLSNNGLLFTASLSVNSDIIKHNYKVQEMIEYFDWIHLKAMNMTPSKTHLIAPLYEDKSNEFVITNVDTAVHKYLTMGVPASKIVLGVPMFGRLYVLADPHQSQPGSPTIGGPKVLFYKDVCVMLKKEPWRVMYESKQHATWAFKQNLWMSWSSIRSVADRVEYAKSMKLGGVAAWSIEQDDHNGLCGPKWPLLKSISSATHGSNVMNLPFPLTDSTLKNRFHQNTVIRCDIYGFAADLKNPTVFYMCIPEGPDYKLIPLTCPYGLVFNPTLNVCDWPTHA